MSCRSCFFSICTKTHTTTQHKHLSLSLSATSQAGSSFGGFSIFSSIFFLFCGSPTETDTHAMLPKHTHPTPAQLFSVLRVFEGQRHREPLPLSELQQSPRAREVASACGLSVRQLLAHYSFLFKLGLMGFDERNGEEEWVVFSTLDAKTALCLYRDEGHPSFDVEELREIGVEPNEEQEHSYFGNHLYLHLVAAMMRSTEEACWRQRVQREQEEEKEQQRRSLAMIQGYRVDLLHHQQRELELVEKARRMEDRLLELEQLLDEMKSESERSKLEMEEELRSTKEKLEQKEETLASDPCDECREEEQDQDEDDDDDEDSLSAYSSDEESEEEQQENLDQEEQGDEKDDSDSDDGEEWSSDDECEDGIDDDEEEEADSPKQQSSDGDDKEEEEEHDELIEIVMKKEEEEKDETAENEGWELVQSEEEEQPQLSDKERQELEDRELALMLYNEELKLKQKSGILSRAFKAILGE
ncbi:Nucleosome assembly protein 1 [Balamuthia mandrillaris]